MSFSLENPVMKDSRIRQAQPFNFLKRQKEQLLQGGFYALIQKIWYLFLLILAVPLVIIVRLLRLLVTVRFGNVDSQRIGRFAINIELYLCERDAGMHGRRKLDFFYFSKKPVYGQKLGKMWKPVCNEQLGKMVKRTVRVCNFMRWVDKANHVFPGWQRHKISFPLASHDVHNLLEKFPVHLNFTLQEERQGYAALRDLGISEKIAFVCLVTRESTYFDALDPQGTYDHHEYINTNFENFIDAAKELIRRGYIVLRMGAVVKEPLKTIFPGIIDYAATARTEFLDIFLSAKCSFYFGGPTGLLTIPMVFRRPRAMTNYVPMEFINTWGANDLSIFKKLWFKQEHRFLTFSETVKSGASRFLRTKEFVKAGLEVIENTPEENTALAIEMDERLKGRWVTTQEDEELQRRFWEIFPESNLHGKIKSRIGAEFLRQNRNLLE